MNIAKRFIIFIFSVSVAACGGGGGGDGGTTATSTATSQSCADVSGLEAIYWDFSNGVIRTDLPNTAFTIPFNVGGSFSDPRQPLIGFIYPQGWTPTEANGVTGKEILNTVAGADMVRSDSQAVWRYVTGQLNPPFTAKGVLDSEVANMLAFFGNPTPVTTLCEINLQEPNQYGSINSIASVMLRAGNITATLTVRIIIVPLGGGPAVNFFVNSLSVGPTTEYSDLIANIFIPMITQFYGGGGSSSECNDGQDNDGDLKSDYPQDPGCTSEVDDDETG